jgi:cell volume regulation protein A
VPTEPFPTAIALIATGLLLVVSVLASRTSGRLGIPVALLFLAIGLLAGEEGLGNIPFDDYGLAFRVGTVALVLILFDGGLQTPLASLRGVLLPAGLLATFGVVATAGMTALCARAVGLDWPAALLLGAIVSSTDAAAVFAVLRSAGVRVRPRLAQILELESGGNDPAAVILTLAATSAIVAGASPGWRMVLDGLVQLAVGLVVGVAIGLLGRRVLLRARLTAAGLYPVLTLGLAFLAFGLPTVFHGSGFLAVYVAGIVLGDARLPYLGGIRRVHDSIAWFAQVGMFLMLGLLAYPSRLASVAGPGLALGLFLAFVARPVVVAVVLAPLRMPWREVVFVSWVGLRGAVPIILATFPVLAGVGGADAIFHIVFFIVVVSTLLQGSTLGFAARKLGVDVAGPPPPEAVLEITSREQLSGEVLSFYVEPASAVAGSPIAHLPFPEGSAVMLIVRERQLLAPKGPTVLEPGDHVYVFAEPGDVPLVKLLFGRAED